MTAFRPGDLVLVAFPESHGSSGKLRPALVLLDSGDDDVVLARVTTQNRTTPFDTPVSDWRGAGLLAPSIIRLNKIVTLEKSLLNRRLGSLTDTDRQRVRQIASSLFAEW